MKLVQSRLDREAVLARLNESVELLERVDLVGPGGRRSERQEKKVQEIAGFSALIIRKLSELFPKGGASILECSCGKSYLALVLNRLVEKEFPEPFRFVGVDINGRLVAHSKSIAADMGLDNVEFVASRTIEFEPGCRAFHAVLALHACDTATDEAIAKAIRLGASLIMVVPCCQNQIRGQLRSGHALEAMSQFGPIRFHLGNILTESLRALYLRAAGYYVEMDEIASPRVTPKNLCLMARKLKHKSGRDRTSEYIRLRDFFGVRPAVERLCPEVLADRRA